MLKSCIVIYNLFNRIRVYLVNRFAEHPSDELEQLQMIVLHERRGGGIEPIFAGSFEQIQRGIEYSLYCLFQELFENPVLIDASFG